MAAGIAVIESLRDFRGFLLSVCSKFYPGVAKSRLRLRRTNLYSPLLFQSCLLRFMIVQESVNLLVRLLVPPSFGFRPLTLVKFNTGSLCF